MSKEGYSPIKEGKSIWISLPELSEGNDIETALVIQPLQEGGTFGIFRPMISLLLK
jgi:hypothetical protein